MIHTIGDSVPDETLKKPQFTDAKCLWLERAVTSLPFENANDQIGLEGGRQHKDQLFLNRIYKQIMST